MLSLKSVSILSNVGRSFSAWHLTAFEGPSALKLDPISRPVVRHPDDLLVRVHAASLNPMDTAMSHGYGRRILATSRCLKSEKSPELPLILGRDFAGTVEYAGSGCASHFRPGDAVYGAVFPSSSGTWTDFVVASKYLTHLKPPSLSFETAAALPYAGLTAWSALTFTAGLDSETTQPSRKVLVLGASGGVGHIALQFLHAWDCQVVAVCSSANREFVQKFKPNHVLSYQDPDYASNLTKLAGFDVILDCSGQKKAETFTPLLKSSPEACFVSLNSPLLSATDDQGLIRGGVKVFSKLVGANFQSLTSSGGTVRWGYFGPIPGALKAMNLLVEQKKLEPVIDRTFDFQDLPLALNHMNSVGQRGKIVLRVQSEK